MTGRRFAAMLLAGALVAAACGGSEGSPLVTQGGSSSATGSASPAAVAAAALVDQWGSDRDAFYVVVWSLDAGYSAGQIIEAAPQGLILADGAITDPVGARIEPVHEPEGLLVAVAVEASGLGVVVAASGPVGSRAVLALVEDQPEDAQVSGLGLLSEAFDGGLNAFHEKQAELQAQAEVHAAAREELEALALEQTELITRLTVELASRGYSGRQILEGILLDQWDGLYREEGTYDGVYGCWYLLSSDGEQVVPDYAPEDPLLELDCAHLLEQAQTETHPEDAEAEGEDEPAEEDNGPPAPGELPGARYEGTFDLKLYETEFNEVTTNTISVVIADGEVTGLSLHFEFRFPSVTSGANNEVLCVAEVGTRAELGPGAIDLTGDELSGSFDTLAYQTFGVGDGCEEDLVYEDPGRLDLEAKIEGDVISGAIISPDGNVEFQARR